MTDKDKYRKTEGVLYNYKKIKAEIDNLGLEIAEVESEYIGCGAITYEERTGSTNKFNSSVENEVLSKRKLIDRLAREQEKKQRLIKKVDNAINTLEGNELKIIQLKFFNEKKDSKISWGEIGCIMNLDADYCRALKRQAIKDLSELIYVADKYSDKHSD